MTWTGQNHYTDVALANYSSKLCGKRDASHESHFHSSFSSINFLVLD
jgi:hypothetical protein